MTSISRDKILLILILFGLGLFLLLQFSVKPTISDDSPGYTQCAIDLAHGNAKACDFARTPGYPLVILLTDTIFGGLNYQLTVFFQYLMVLGVGYFIYRLAMIIFQNKTAAYISFFLVAANPVFIFYSNNLLTEVPFMFFLTGFAYYFIRYLYEQKNSQLVMTSLYLGASTLVRPFPQYFLSLVILILFFLHYKTLRQFFKKTLIVTAIFAVLVGPWILKNTAQYHEKSLTIFLGYALWVNVFRADKLPIVDSGLYAQEKEIIKQKDMAGSYTVVWHMLYDRYQNPVTVDRIMKEISFETIKKYPLAYLKGTVLNFLKLTFYPKYLFGDYLLKDQVENLRPSPLASYLYYAFKDLMHKVNYPVLLLTLLGMAGAVVNFIKTDVRGKSSTLVISAITLCILAIPSVLTVPNYRYRVPIDQFFILFASYALVYFWSRLGLGRHLKIIYR